ncbi:MAG: acyl-CoA dehydratase activase-related protein [Bacillota bacterium]
MPARVGIPGTLLYYLYFPVWETFFRNIGAEVVTSGKTNKKALDYGVKEALADACVPIKLYFGHVLNLIEKGVDYLFVPRVVCLNGETTYCPKFLGLPDMIRHVLTDLPPLIDARMDVREGTGALFRAYSDAGRALGAKWPAVAQAYAKAMLAGRRFFALLQAGYQPPEALEIFKNRSAVQKSADKFLRKKTELVFAILGYPYLVHDQFVSVGLLNKLSKMGIKAVTAENLPAKPLARQPHILDKRLFWTFSDLAYKATQFLLQRGGVDGIIHLTAFGCGPDAMLDKFMEMLVKERSSVPFMSLTVDEHSGEAGMTTRLEAFADMVRRKKGAAA